MRRQPPPLPLPTCPNPSRRDWVRSAAAGLACTAAGVWPTTGQAQTAWPSKPVRLIVPAPAGGPFDRLIRPIAQDMAAALGQPFVIDNRPSAGNIVGTQAAAASAPDGYTLVMTGMVNTITQGLHEKLPFDIVNDFVHISAIGEGAQCLVAGADSGIASLADVLARARREPEKLGCATSGAGSAGHLLLALLERATGAQLLHVPYKGGAPALNDVLGGVVPLALLPQNVVQAHVLSGKLRGLAVSGRARSPGLPQVPTLAELGHPQLTVTSWVGLSAPKGTPAEVVQKVHAALWASLAKPAISGPPVAEGLAMLKTSPEQYAALVKADTERWGALVRSLKLKPE